MPQEFVTIFTDEHRQMREVLLDLIDAFENQDQERALEAIVEMETLAAPHFHHEQTALYPALAEVHGDEQIDQLLQEHADAVEAAAQLTDLAAQDSLDEEAAAYGADLARQLLPHVSEPDEVAVMLEVLEPKTKKQLHKAHREAKKKGITLKAVAKAAAKKASGKKPVRKAAAKAKAGTAKRSVKPAASKGGAKRAGKGAPKASKPAARERKQSRK